MITMAEPKILIVVGTLRKNGFNEQLAEKIEKLLEGKAEVSRLDYADLPLMNQDLEDPEPESVKRIRDAVREADGIWFVSPQYNGSYPGHIKNLVDWLSRPLPGQGRDSVVIAGKKATVSGAGGRTATAEMREMLDKLLRFVGVLVMEEGEAGIALSGESWGSGKLVLGPADEEALEAQANTFLGFLEA
ncbi:MAG: NAD(P)H-dependent oxidoreductase [Atopobium sp.]|jgi:NAD(P)H-dependent FMN reductase